MTTLDQIAQAALSSKETIHTTYALAVRCLLNKVPGDFVECGVFGGAQCAAMALACMKIGVVRKVHLFDSFEGVPEAGPNDTNWPHAKGTSACSLADVQANMNQWGIAGPLLAYHPGWFEERIPIWARSKTPIAILRLDADLYESTRVCIEHLYPLVSPGGWIIVDDFALPGCRKAVDDFMNEQKPGYPPVYFQKHV